ncbi:MAG: LuxR family transcriptional regulator [Casimicrobiaceae bacterium]
MLRNLAIGKVVVGRGPYVPSALRPLVEAAEAGRPLEPPLTSIVRSFGFDSFMYAMSVDIQSTNLRIPPECQSYVFTTLPIEWVARYDQLAYIEIDPRILKTWESAIPLVWDSRSERGVDKRTDDFLDDAANHGVASGVAMPIHDAKYHRIAVALNSANPIIDDRRGAEIARRLGEIVLLGTYFHELFCKGVVARDVPPASRGASLSPRQCECLLLAAHGLTTEDIAFKLGISVRTAQFHFDGIRSKLGAANRQEAVAIAIGKGVIRP